MRNYKDTFQIIAPPKGLEHIMPHKVRLEPDDPVVDLDTDFDLIGLSRLIRETELDLFELSDEGTPPEKHPDVIMLKHAYHRLDNAQNSLTVSRGLAYFFDIQEESETAILGNYFHPIFRIIIEDGEARVRLNLADTESAIFNRQDPYLIFTLEQLDTEFKNICSDLKVEHGENVQLDQFPDFHILLAARKALLSAEITPNLKQPHHP